MRKNYREIFTQWASEIHYSQFHVWVHRTPNANPHACRVARKAKGEVYLVGADRRHVVLFLLLLAAGARA